MYDFFCDETYVQGSESFDYIKHNDLILLNDLQDREIRNIAVMYIKSEYRNNIKYLLILGVDIFTQKLVRLVDTYGKQYGLCRYCDDFKNIRRKTVIKVPCKIHSDGLNTLRIIGKVTILGETDFTELRIKFCNVFPMACGFFPYHNIDVPTYITVLENNPGKEFYARVSIMSTIVKYRDSKYQIKFSKGDINRFVDILDEKFLKKHPNLNGKLIKGIALVKGVFINDSMRIYVIKISNYSFYESRRAYDKICLKRKYSRYSDAFIDKLLDKGFTVRSPKVPKPVDVSDYDSNKYTYTYIPAKPRVETNFSTTDFDDDFDEKYLVDNTPYNDFSNKDEIYQMFLNRDY